MAIALVAFGAPQELEPAAHQRCREIVGAAQSVPGVTGGNVFHRETPDDAPSANTFGSRGLLIAELAPDRPDNSALLAGLEAATGGRALGVHEYKAQYRREQRESDLGKANGILIALLNDASTEGEAAFVEWYEGAHLRECVEDLPYWIGTHYEVVAEPPTPMGARHMGLLETDRSDARQAHNELLKVWPAMSQWPHELVHAGAYARCVS